ncbi:MAG: hypothetical protein EOO09_02420 [Chitinophagaceae bacterium]|nr:MAG: hypothetical protein EOO09_02420 [Chitinophagaceae bacterium]
MLTNRRLSILYFLNLIKWDALAIFSYTLIIGMTDNLPHLRDIRIPITLAALVGTLLSLLLGFRTAQSYERWWEARNIWGSIVNDSRTFVRQMMQFLPATPAKQKEIQELAIRQYIWCFALANTMRKCPMPSNVQEYIDANGIGDTSNLPNRLLTAHGEQLFRISEDFKLDDNKQVQLDSTLQRLTDSMGRCERIKNTVFPRSYSLLIHFLIYVLMTILPFGLEHNNPIVEIFISTLIPLLFIAIERTAILMQDPFENKPTDTPMTALSQTIERNLREMSGLRPVDGPPPLETYYQM